MDMEHNLPQAIRRGGNIENINTQSAIQHENSG